MRVLHVADLHFDLRHFGWVYSRADEFDAVVIAGDLLSQGAGETVDEQVVQISSYLRRIAERTNLMICSGNHDLNYYISENERAADWLHELDCGRVFVDGEPCSIGNWLFTICPWNDGPQTAEFIRHHFDDTVPSRDQTWVWVHHAPPSDTRISSTGRGDHGDSGLRRAISRRAPQIVLCGHVHQAPFIKGGSWHDEVDSTLVLNGGRQDGEWPSHIELDSDLATAAWRSQAGEETISLNDYVVAEAMSAGSNLDT